MVAEERGLIIAVGEHADRNQKIYDEWYSVTRLRERAARIVEASPFGDLWIGLKQTFSLFEYGLDANALGIPPLNGDLFDEKRAIPDLAQAELHNHELLLAIRHLSLFKAGTAFQRVNYSGLDVEELGSVYESLLDFKPVIAQGEHGLTFDLRTGTERKSTGSYYTRPELVHELVESALVPVMEDRIAAAEKAASGKNLIEERTQKTQAILSLSVCDPACGSGHFLLAAARRLGKELARIKTGEDEPRPEDFHLAVREVISHCIYGVDLNPLAVDLCKLALWLEGHWAGKPLSFLDHRIRCGNSLIGVLDPEILEPGLPDDAFNAVTGDDKKVAAYFKKRNKQDRTSRGLAFEPDEHVTEYAAANRELRDLVENTAAEVRKKAEMYGGWRAGMQHCHDEAVSDLWTAQFFVPLTDIADAAVCTTKDFLEFAVDNRKKPQQVAAARALAARNRFFHWHLEFPEVFQNKGFDIVLGNPPWERIKLQEKEHWVDDPYIANAANKAERSRRLEEYRISGDPAKKVRLQRFETAKHDSEADGKFCRMSGRFPLSAVGDVNTYALFSELATQLATPKGRVGILVPTGIVTDDTTKQFFADIVSQGQLASVTGFENEEFIFPAVHHAFKFCALTIGGKDAKTHRADLVFWCRRFSDVLDQQRHFKLSADDLKTISPNTQSCPTFRTAADAELSLKLYRRCPVLWKESAGNESSWRMQFLSMFHMANDSGLFVDSVRADYLPLYEAKMMRQFDHRWATYEGATRENLNAGILPQLPDLLKKDPTATVKPRYWVQETAVSERLEGWKHKWLIGFRDITAAMVERTGIFSVLPYAAVGHSISLMLPLARAQQHELPLVCCLLANLNSLTTDFVIRTKLTYIHLSYFVLKQIPVLPPQNYSLEDVRFIVPRVL